MTYNFTQPVVFQSKLYPGIEISLRRLTVPLRTKIDLEAASYYEHEREAALALPPVKEPDSPAARALSLRYYDESRRRAVAELAPVVFKHCVVEIQGCTGLPEFCEVAPTDLIEELLDFIQGGMRTTQEETKNSPSPSTSPK